MATAPALPSPPHHPPPRARARGPRPERTGRDGTALPLPEELPPGREAEKRGDGGRPPTPLRTGPSSQRCLGRGGGGAVEAKAAHARAVTPWRRGSSARRSKGRRAMAAVAAAARGGLRGALLVQQQRWSSGSGADQVGAGDRAGGARPFLPTPPLTAVSPCSWASWAKAPGRAAAEAALSARLGAPSGRSRRPRRSGTLGERGAAGPAAAADRLRRGGPRKQPLSAPGNCGRARRGGLALGLCQPRPQPPPRLSAGAPAPC